MAEWIAINHGVSHLLHYVDDFLTGGRTKADCNANIASTLAVFAELGIPVNREKLAREGTPSTTFKFLGIQFDTANMCASVDTNRLAEIRSILSSWDRKKLCNKKELQSLIGILSFAAKVVHPGRIFLRRLIDKLSCFMSPKHCISISASMRADLDWWCHWLPEWNGISLFYEQSWSTSSSIELWTDASLLGYGVVYGSHWISREWSSHERQVAQRATASSIAYFELFAIVSAAATFGKDWRGKKILFHSDSQTAVDVVGKGYCKQPDLMSLIRALFFCAARFGFTLRVVHVPGTDNLYADLLSRLQVSRFLELRPDSDPSPTIPSPILHLN
jgi:hypothetical protein